MTVMLEHDHDLVLSTLRAGRAIVPLYNRQPAELLAQDVDDEVALLRSLC